MRERFDRVRIGRRLREGQRQAESFGSQTEQQLDRHLIKRFSHLKPVRRFVISWLCLVLIIIGALIGQNLALGNYYQTLQSVAGGIYNEGVQGRFTNASPLYAVSEADATVSKLIFAGLLTYDEHGKLAGDLARDYSADSKGLTYTVRLKPDLKWQDGKPLTSADVVFTYQSIQNPDAQSPLRNSWQGIEVTAPDPQTVVFKLPGVLAAFPYNLTNGIVPKHLLANIKPVDLRSADFNTVKPVGAGPFAWQAIDVTGNGDPKKSQQQIALKPFEAYQGGKPALQQMVVKIYADQEHMVNAFSDNQLTGMSGLDVRPPRLKGKKDVIEHNLPLRAATMVFFKTSGGILADVNVRQALVKSADVAEIVRSLDYPTRQIREPFLAGQTGYDPSLVQPAHDLKAAEQQLEQTGWRLNSQGIRSKEGKPLTFTLTAADTPEYRKVADKLKQQWRQAGVDLKVRLIENNEVQNLLNSHDYEALLHGISIGPDPDVFVYWDSSQMDLRSPNRLNLSEYKNAIADAALESGRTRVDPTLRTLKYKPFLQEWQKDAPALGLYQPRVLYLTNGLLDGLDEVPINTSTDRLNNVDDWKIREARVTN